MQFIKCDKREAILSSEMKASWKQKDFNASQARDLVTFGVRKTWFLEVASPR